MQVRFWHRPSLHKTKMLFLESEFEELKSLHERRAHPVAFIGVRLLCRQEYALARYRRRLDWEVIHGDRKERQILILIGLFND